MIIIGGTWWFARMGFFYIYFSLKQCNWCYININNKESNEKKYDNQFKCMIYTSICASLMCLQNNIISENWWKLSSMQAFYQPFQFYHFLLLIFTRIVSVMITLRCIIISMIFIAIVVGNTKNYFFIWKRKEISTNSRYSLYFTPHLLSTLRTFPQW